ncbi:MAG: hypothetical protein AB1657_05145 [Candidatus Micrarchaeota archaeon]
MSEKKAMEKLEGLGKSMLGQVKKGESPTFETPLRSKGNVEFQEGLGYLQLGGKKEERTFLNVSQARTFMQTVAVANKTKRFIAENLHTSIRGLYYQLKFSLGEDVDESLFEEQSESNVLIEDLEVSLGIKREDLHLTTDRKGVVAGPMVVKDNFAGEETTIDCAKQGRSGWMIPSDVDNGMEFVEVDADYVLCLAEDEKVVIIDNEEAGIRTVKELYDSVKSANRDMQVVSYNSDYKTCKNDLLAISKRKACAGEKLVTITSKSGAEARVSENHKIPVLTPEGMKVVAAKDVKRGDFLLEAKNLQIELQHPESFDLIEMLKNEVDAGNAYVAGAAGLITERTAEQLGLMVTKTVDGKTYTYPYQYLADGWKQRDSVPLKHYMALEQTAETRKRLKIEFSGAGKKDGVNCIIRLDNNFARLLGYYLAEGHLYGYQVGFSFAKKEEEYQKEVCELIEKVFGIGPEVYPHGGEVQIFAQNKAVALFFRKLGAGNYAHNKRVPGFVFGMPPEFIKNMLECYLRGDGYRNGDSYRSTTVSKDLHHGLNLLFRRLGVPTYTVKIKGRKTFEKYNCMDSYAIDLVRKYSDGDGQAKSHHLWERYPLFFVSAYRNRKTVPYFCMGYKTINKALISGFNDPDIKKWLEADVHPVEVRKVEMNNYNGDFYELVAVSPTHVFMHASGLFTHNCVEKDALWQRLNEDRFWKKENCILVTPKGQASRGTRRLLRKLADKKLSVFVLTDCDAWGWYIYWTIKTGSMNLAYLGRDFSIPESRFLGVTMADIERHDFLKKLTINAKEIDLKRAEEMLGYPWINRHKEWVVELQKVLKTKKKLEQDALQGERLTFVGDYVREKISKKMWLP